MFQVIKLCEKTYPAETAAIKRETANSATIVSEIMFMNRIC